MNHGEAVAAVGRIVIYRPPHLRSAPESKLERGIIKWVSSERLAHVLYTGDSEAKATYLEDLSLEEKS